MVTVDGSSTHEAFAGTHPDIDADRWQILGDPFDLTCQAAPGTFYGLLASVQVTPIDLGAPLWEMLGLADPSATFALGLVDPSGSFTLPVQLPALSVFLGVAPVVQLVQADVSAGLQMRFSNALFLHGVPE